MTPKEQERYIYERKVVRSHLLDGTNFKAAANALGVTPTGFAFLVAKHARHAVRSYREHEADNNNLIEEMRKLIEIQGREGNWNFDPYMQGLFNGMELMLATAERRGPQFRTLPGQKRLDHKWHPEENND